MGRLVIWSLGIVLALAILLAALVLISPWPGVLALRFVFDRGAEAAQARVAALVPDDVISRMGVAPADFPSDMAFDLHRPAGTETVALPAVVWIHGGGFVSGRPGDVANYSRILADQGFAVVSAGYTIAPEARFPTPVVQVNRLLEHLAAHAGDYGIDPSRIVLAGDSAGAQIAAQVALVTTSPDAAAELDIRPALPADGIRGVLLFCGPFDLSRMNGRGIGGWFVNTTAWSYSGSRDWREDASFARFSVAGRVTPTFPPTFITVGNADPLAPQSKIMAEALERAGVGVETLFFPDDHVPPLAHEYQFDLTTADGQRAFDLAVAFTRRVTADR
jgi:acetyl esterase/lipase